MARSLRKLGYDAWTPGERELTFGLARLLELGRETSSSPVSANLAGSNGALLFPDRVIRTLGDVRVGITGILGKSVAQSVNLANQEFQVMDPFESLAPVVRDLRSECDVVVVLAHAGPGDARRIAEEVPGVDLIVVGHNPGYMYSPDRVGDVLLMRSGNRGQYAAALTLTFDEGRKIADYKGVVEPLNDGVPSDPELSSEAAAFMEELRKLKAEKKREEGG